MLEIAGVLPTQGPFVHPTPVARSTFCDKLSLETADFALDHAAAHSGEMFVGTLVLGAGPEDVLVEDADDEDWVVEVEAEVELVVEVVDEAAVVEGAPGRHW